MTILTILTILLCQKPTSRPPSTTTPPPPQNRRIGLLKVSDQVVLNLYCISSLDHTIHHHEGSLSTMREINGTLDSIKELLQRTIENDPLPTLLEINSTLDLIKGLLSTEDDPLRNISEINQDLDAIKSLLKTIRQNQSQPPPRAIVNSAPAQVVDLRTGSTSSRRRPSPRPKTSTGRRRGSFLRNAIRTIIG